VQLLASSEKDINNWQQPRICFIGSTSSFVTQDLKILSKHYDLEVIQTPKRKGSWPKVVFKIARAQSRDYAYFCWFAGWHSLFAIAFNYRRRPVVVVVGGYDAANVPEIDYGAFRNFKERIAARYVLRRATRICVVDGSLKNDVMTNAKIDGATIITIPTGYDPDHFKPGGPKERLVLTVGGVTEEVARRKGYDHFIEAARELPDVTFALVGKWSGPHIESMKMKAPNNVIFTGFVNDEELLRWYQRAKVYCQLSRYEGLPNALCEAMLCECVPVGTRYCGIPTAIGDTGYYVDYGDVKGIREAISKALSDPPDKGTKARERISSGFKIETREKELVSLIDNLIGGNP
jgi:glycosyltransferase involved in cell wall biosynthesis